ncbi:MAG: TolC family protein, partial [Verrucomicrobia bacterium]|nr:TolC family protein [Verrucomicrobiota bacterium]
ALGSDVAFQDYRKHLMTVISTAEAAYWNLYLAQEQMRFFRDSVALAETLASDAKTREKAGLGSELDTLQAEAGLELRRSKLNEARQRFHESLAQARNLAGVSGESTDSIELLDTPRAGTVSTTFQEAGAGALSRNPDYLSQVAKLAQEDIRIAYAKNQRLPQLDLKASYGLNGLGLTPGQSTDEALTGSFASWTAGAEMRVPVGGGKRSRNELQAARLRKQEALIGLQEVETQILNALESSIRKIASTESSANAYRKVVQFNEDLLKSQMTRVEVGKVESRKILEVEADLFESRNAVIEALVQHERARLELGFVEGALLGQRNLDLPQAYVQERTRLMIRQAAGSEERFKAIFEDLKKEYQRTQPPNNQSPAP